MIDPYDIYGGYSTPADPTVMDRIIHRFHFGIDPDVWNGGTPVQMVHILPTLPNLPSDQEHNYSQPDSYTRCRTPATITTKWDRLPYLIPGGKRKGSCGVHWRA